MTDEDDPHSHHCECGDHHGPVTVARRERLERCSRLVDDWLAAALSGIHHRQAAAIAPIQGFLHLAPSLQDAHVRLVGLTTITARRCAQLLPRPPRSRRDGYWAIRSDPDGRTLDEVPGYVGLAVRLVTAYANGDDDAATDLVMAYLRPLDLSEMQHEMWETFMYLSNVYLQIDDCARVAGNQSVKHGLRVIGSRLAAAWRQGTTRGAAR